MWGRYDTQLEDVEGGGMYSPKISEELVPVLYRLGKARRVPMTRLVDLLIRRALAAEEVPQEVSAPSTAGKEAPEVAA